MKKPAKLSCEPCRGWLWSPVTRSLWFGLVLAFCFAGPARFIELAAQEAVPPPVQGSPPTLDVATVEAALAAMEADTSMEAAVKDLLRSKYQEALESVKTAADFAARAFGYREALESGPGRVAELRAQLEVTPVESPGVEDFPDETAEELQKSLQSLRMKRDGLTEELAANTAELSELKERPVGINTRQPEAKGELVAAQDALGAAKKSEEAPSPRQAAELMALEAREMRLLSELEMLKQEQLSQAVREDLLRARRDLLTRQIEVATASVELFAAEVNDRLASEARSLVSAADQSTDLMFASDPEGQALLAEVQGLTKEFESVVESVRAASAAQGETKAKSDRLARDHDFIAEFLKLGGQGETITEVLFNLLEGLPGTWVQHDNLQSLRTDLDRARLGALSSEQRLREQLEVEARFADRSSEAVTELLVTRKDVLVKLSTQYRNMIRSLAALHGDEVQYGQKVREVREFAFEQLFKVRSVPPLGWSTLGSLPEGVRWLFSAEQWAELGSKLHHAVTSMPFLTGFCLIVLLGLILARGRLNCMLLENCNAARRTSTAGYGSTLRALLASLLLALPIPLVLYAADVSIASAPDASDWLRGFGKGMDIVTWLAFGVAFLTVICRDKGLGVSIFGWNLEAVRRFRQCAVLFALVAIPFFLVTVRTLYADGGHYFESLGRISFMLVELWAAFLFWRLFRFSDGMFASLIRKHPTSLFVRFRHVWFLVLIAIPLSLVGLAAAGYLVTALQLGLGYLATIGIVAGGVVLYWLVLSWFMIREKKLLLAETIEKRRLLMESFKHEEEGETDSEAVILDEEDDKLDLGAIGEQTRHLLRTVFIACAALWLGALWSQTVPIFEALDGVHILGQLTLLEVALAILVITISYIVVHNLPGVMELGGLRLTNLEVGTRVAITTLTQYTVVAIAAAVVFHLLALDFSKLGWIIAALSVGLGFGLQEVVLNFVCGLILLFELPIRVGDIVTVDGVTGTVMRIHLRATTILNWDRQEYVVPNKTFVTGAFVNWTLTNAVTRLMLSVGVAYGSDTERAREILLSVAHDQPNVLEDPPPAATFEEFGESSLTLRLRTYLPNIENRLGTLTELHAEIDKRFGEAGIVIAFPQRDLHIRNWNQSNGGNTSPEST